MKNHRAHSAAPSVTKAGPESSPGSLNPTDRTSTLPAAPSGHTPEPLGLKRRHFMSTALALDAAALLAACGGGGGGGDSGSTNTSGSSSGSSSGNSSGSSSASSSTSSSSSASSSSSGSGSGSGSGSAAPTQWVVTTLAGTGGIIPFADGTGGTATFSIPSGITLDNSGSLYVVDQGRHRIRKINPDGLVSTFAGTGSSGYLDGTGGTAQFNYPSGVALDTSGNLYVADTSNHLIRKISPAGVVTTLAGGANTTGIVDGMGITARFNSPFGVAVDQSGYVYLADKDNHLIRKISPQGIVTTLAGVASTSGSADGMGTAARFNSPSSVAVDHSGTVYVADANNHLIRKITPQGVVTTLAGVASTSGSADGMGTAARFNSPSSVALDTTGTVYVSDQSNHRIRKITSVGLVSTLAGGAAGFADGTIGTAQFNSPAGVAVDANGNLYVSDQDNRRIRKITPIY